MSKFKLVIVLTITMLGLFSCRHAALLYSSIHYDWEKKYDLENQDTVFSISVPSFKTVKYNGPFDVEIVSDVAPGITVKTDKGLSRYFRYYIKDGNLNFFFKRGARLPNGKVKVGIKTPDLTSITKLGAGHLVIRGDKQFPSLSLKQTGSGSIDAFCNISLLDCKVTGSGKIVVRGEIGKVGVSKRNTGKIIVNGKKI